MRITDQVSTLIANPEINNNANDVRWASGWDRKIHTAQYRFGSAETKALIKAIKEQSPARQRSLVRELDRRSTQGHYVGSLSFISKASAAAMNALAKELGLPNTFDADARKATAPMG